MVAELASDTLPSQWAVDDSSTTNDKLFVGVTNSFFKTLYTLDSSAIKSFHRIISCR